MSTSNDTLQTIVVAEDDKNTFLRAIGILTRTITIQCDAEDAEQANHSDFRQLLLVEAIRDRLTDFIERGVPLVPAA